MHIIILIDKNITAMARLIFFVSFFYVLTACNVESKEQQAIRICKNARVHFFSDNQIEQLLLLYRYNLTAESTWLDFVNVLASSEPNVKNNWSAKKTEDLEIYVVSFADDLGWGHKWEVNLTSEIVKHINTNEFLKRKYGLSGLSKEELFIVTSVTVDTLRHARRYNPYSRDNTKEVTYIIEGLVKNNTDKIITNTELTGTLQVIFEEKTVEAKGDLGSGLKKRINKSTPWKPQEELPFRIETKGVEDVLIQYVPEYVFFTLGLLAEDPVGYSFKKDISEFDLKEKWLKLGD